MTHLPPVLPRDAGLFVRFTYWMARRRLGRVPAPLGIMAHHTSILAAVGGFELALERADRLEVHLRELANVKAASLVGCRFCIDIGGALAHKNGVSEAKLRALPLHDSSPEFSTLERLVLDYVVQMTETPSRPDPEIFRALQEQLGTPALVELTAVIAWENFRARFNHAVGAQEEGFSENMACLLPPAGPPTAARRLADAAARPGAVRAPERPTADHREPGHVR
jgi:AhpD family alkylhydroperoxidase